jgi:predicted nucleotidyltransferase
MPQTILSKRRKELKERLRQKAIKRLEFAAKSLYDRGAKEVYVFGSVLRPMEFNERSDVDIAVEGIPDDEWHYIIDKLEDIFREIPFDIVFLEDDLRSEVRERIKKEGILWKR